MISDFLIGVAASLFASFIVGFFTNKLFGKSCNDVIFKIFSLYMCGCVFIASLMCAYIINSDIVKLIDNMAEANTFNLYKYTSSSFILIFLQFSIVTIAFLIILYTELSNKAMDKIQKNAQKWLSKLISEVKMNEI